MAKKFDIVKELDKAIKRRFDVITHKEFLKLQSRVEKIEKMLKRNRK